MMPKVETWMLFRGDGKDGIQVLGTVTVTGDKIQVAPISQYIDLRDKDGKTFASITWPSTVKVRKVGE